MKSVKQKKNPIRWTGQLIKDEGTKMYGDKILYHLVDLDLAITYGILFHLQCAICTFIWHTNTDKFIHKKRGCPWCENEGIGLLNYTLDMVVFIGTKIHHGKYTYINNSADDIKTGKDYINGRCAFGNHGIFSDTISLHLSRNKKVKPRGCLECNELEKSESVPLKRWKGDLERVKIEGRRIHGNIYNYDKNDPINIKNGDSLLIIECLQIRNEKICGNIFNQSITLHINQKVGCIICSKRMRYNKTIFITSAEEKYPGKFLYHRIQENDVTDCDSKPTVECAFCGFLINRTVSTFINNETVCLRCTGLEPWSAERLKLSCIEKEKEGEYTYENVLYDGEINKNTIICITCIACNLAGYSSKFTQSVSSHFVIMHGCLRCSGNLPWNFIRFQSEIPEILKEQYSYDKVTEEMFEGKTAKTCIIPIDCKICKNEFKRTIDEHIILLRGCNFCTKSEGEQLVYTILKSLNINFLDEVPIREGEKCRYDFKFLYNEKWTIIEYDGKQHFEMTPHWHKTIGNFEVRKSKDIYKQYVALKQDYKVIRIDYEVQKKDFRLHIMNGLQCIEQVYYSNPKLYEWLEDGVKNYVPNHE